MHWRPLRSCGWLRPCCRLFIHRPTTDYSSVAPATTIMPFMTVKTSRLDQRPRGQLAALLQLALDFVFIAFLARCFQRFFYSGCEIRRQSQFINVLSIRQSLACLIDKAKLRRIAALKLFGIIPHRPD